MMNFVAKIGRNQPCLCGSSKKYKRCCGAVVALKPTPASASTPPILIIEDDGLDDLSNSVLDLIEERRFDEALAVCRRLLDEFPDVDDGFERSALVHEAMGNHALAADFYRRAYAFVSDPVRRDGYDDELIDDLRLRAENNERLAGPR